MVELLVNPTGQTCSGLTCGSLFGMIFGLVKCVEWIKYVAAYACQCNFGQLCFRCDHFMIMCLNFGFVTETGIHRPKPVGLGSSASVLVLN